MHSVAFNGGKAVKILANPLGERSRRGLWTERVGFDRSAFCKLFIELLLQIKPCGNQDFESLVRLLLSHGFLLSCNGF